MGDVYGTRINDRPFLVKMPRMVCRLGWWGLLLGIVLSVPVLLRAQNAAGPEEASPTTQPAEEVSTVEEAEDPADPDAPATAQNSPFQGQRFQAVRFAIRGDWVAGVGREVIHLQIYDNQRLFLGDQPYQYQLEGQMLRLIDESGGVHEHQVQLTKDGLTLSGGGLTEPLAFTRQAQIQDFLSRLFDISPQQIVRRITRIGVIVAILLVSWLVVSIARRVSNWLINVRWRFINEGSRNRSRTIHALVLNVVKYVVFFTALGFILAEIGINYTAYLASLSVVGLAIGFGSQGLVQDMVTGLFVIIEGQYNVGDMVEISGQAGVVQDLGLRMTRIRNYLGQTVVIPNRNIAIVNNFSKGAQQVHVDVALRPDDVQRAQPLLDAAAREVAQQFAGVVIWGPLTNAPSSLSVGEQYVRIDLEVWPQQTWLIDQQLLPRLREALKGEQITPVGDRIAVFYHGRKRQAA